MRPKKRIFLIDSNDDRRGRLGFMLRVNGYATPECADGTVDLVLACDPDNADNCVALKRFCHCPLIVISKAKTAPLILGAEAVLTASVSILELLERIRVLTARKRGPRKGFRKPPQTATPEPAATAATA